MIDSPNALAAQLRDAPFADNTLLAYALEQKLIALIPELRAYDDNPHSQGPRTRLHRAEIWLAWLRSERIGGKQENAENLAASLAHILHSLDQWGYGE